MSDEQTIITAVQALELAQELINAALTSEDEEVLLIVLGSSVKARAA